MSKPQLSGVEVSPVDDRFRIAIDDDAPPAQTLSVLAQLLLAATEESQAATKATTPGDDETKGDERASS